MIIVILFVAFFMGLAFFSTVHALGMWLLLMIVHGAVVNALGDTAVHLPLYVGLVTALVILARRLWSGVNTGTLVLFGIMVVIMGIAGMMGMDPGTSLTTMTLYAKGFLLALLLAGCLKSEKDIRVMTLYCLASLLVGALMAIYQYKTGTFAINTIYERRAGGLSNDPNDTAMLLVAGVPLAIYWFLNTKNLVMKLFFAGSLPLILIGIGLTGSRGGFVTLAAISLVIYLRRPTVQLTVAGLLMLAVAATLAPKSYWHHMDTLVSGKEQHGGRSLASRALLLKKGISIFVHHPALGVGPGNFGNAYTANSTSSAMGMASTPKLAISSEKQIVAHNMYLEFFAENGVIGGMLWLIILYMAVRRLMVYDRYNPARRKGFGLGYALALALGGMLFAGMFLSQGKNSVLWFLIGLGLAAGQLTAKARRASSPATIAPGTPPMVKTHGTAPSLPNPPKVAVRRATYSLRNPRGRGA